MAVKNMKRMKHQVTTVVHNREHKYRLLEHLTKVFFIVLFFVTGMSISVVFFTWLHDSITDYWSVQLAENIILSETQCE